MKILEIEKVEEEKMVVIPADLTIKEIQNIKDYWEKECPEDKKLEIITSWVFSDILTKEIKKEYEK